MYITVCLRDAGGIALILVSFFFLPRPEVFGGKWLVVVSGGGKTHAFEEN